MSVTSEFEKKADETVSRYPVSKRSAALPLLHLWQDEHGFVSGEGIHWIASRLSLQPINILELVTFYPMLRQEPAGKIHIKVCRTLSCALAGSHEIYKRFKELTGANGDEEAPVTSPDGKFTIEFVECLASCGTAPVVMINDELHQSVDQQKAEEIFRQN